MRRAVVRAEVAAVSVRALFGWQEGLPLGRGDERFGRAFRRLRRRARRPRPLRLDARRLGALRAVRLLDGHPHGCLWQPSAMVIDRLAAHPGDEAHIEDVVGRRQQKIAPVEGVGGGEERERKTARVRRAQVDDRQLQLVRHRHGVQCLPDEQPACAEHQDDVRDSSALQLAQHVSEHRLARQRHEHLRALRRIERAGPSGTRDDRSADIAAAVRHHTLRLALALALVALQRPEQAGVAAVPFEAAALARDLPQLDGRLVSLVDLGEARQLFRRNDKRRVVHPERLEQNLTHQLVERAACQDLEKPTQNVGGVRVAPRFARVVCERQAAHTVDELDERQLVGRVPAASGGPVSITHRPVAVAVSQAGGVREQIGECDLAPGGHRLARRQHHGGVGERGQVVGDGLVELKVAALIEAHRADRDKRLAERVQAHDSIRRHRAALLGVRHPTRMQVHELALPHDQRQQTWQLARFDPAVAPHGELAQPLR
eukprot:3546038-Prymnesium_polylepis.1